MKKRLLEGPLLGPLLGFSVPLVLGMVGHAFFNLVDVFLVGRLSPEAVAGAHLATVFNFVPMILFNGVGVATVALVSRATGKGEVQQAATIARRSMILTTGLGVFLGFLGYVTAGVLVDWLRTTEEVAPLAQEYLEIVSLGTISMFVLLQVTSILRAVGESIWPMILLIGGNLLNVLMSIVLIFGWGPIPAMGVAGAAWATVFSRALFGILGVAVLARRGFLGGEKGFPWRKIGNTSWELVRIGVPQGFQIFCRVVAVLGITSLVQYWDNLSGNNAGAAALGVGVRLDMLALFGAAGWGAAASTVVGLNLGAGQPGRASRGVLGILLLSSAMMAVVGVVYYWLSESLYRLFLEEPSLQLLQIGSEYLRVLVFSYFFVNIGIVVSGALNGAGHTGLPFLLDFLGFACILYPLASWVIDGYGLTGIWWTVVGINVVLAGVYLFFFYRAHKANWNLE